MPSPGIPLAALLVLSGCALHEYEARPLEADPLARAFLARSLDDADLVALARPSRGPEPSSTPIWDFDALTRVALALRPELEVARTAVDEARAAVVTAEARPNPRLDIDPEIALGADDPWILGWALAIPLEGPGRRELRTTVAEEKLRAELLRWPLAAWSVRVDVRRAVNELGAARTEVAQAEERLAVEQQRLESEREALAAGAIDRFELARAERAHALADVLRSDARERESRALSALAEALGMPRAALATAAIDARRIDPWPAPPDAERARTLALDNRLDLFAGLAEYAAADAELRLEIARQIPGVEIAPGYTYDQGERKVALGVSVELPLLDHNEGPIAEAEARRASSAARFVALEQSVLGGVESSRVAYAEALERRSSRQQAEELARAETGRLERALAAGAVGRRDVLEARITQLELARALAEADDESQRALLELESVLQVPLSAEEGAPGESGTSAP